MVFFRSPTYSGSALPPDNIHPNGFTLVSQPVISRHTTLLRGLPADFDNNESAKMVMKWVNGLTRSGYFITTPWGCLRDFNDIKCAKMLMKWAAGPTRGEYFITTLALGPTCVYNGCQSTLLSFRLPPDFQINSKTSIEPATCHISHLCHIRPVTPPPFHNDCHY